MNILEKMSMRLFYAMFAAESLILPSKQGPCERVKTAWKILTSK